MRGFEHRHPEVPVRPVVKTALRRLWRDPTTLQIGVHADRALVLSGVGGRAAELVAALDGTRDHDDLRATARELGLASGVADRLVDLLVEAAVVDDASTDPAVLATLSHVERDRLAPDLASISLVSGRPDGGVSALQRRREALVRVVGGGRVGATVASLLAAAGVGHVVVDDPEICRAHDCAPAGAAIGDTGASRAGAAHAAMHRVSGSIRTGAPEPGKRFDLVVLAPAGAWAPHAHENLLRTGTPHLLVTVRETTGAVGPFVVPGITACLRCLDLHRTDRDPAWPMIAAQLATDPRRSTSACDVTLATLVASVAALQALAWLDDGGAARSPVALPTHDGTLEITLPDWRIRRRPWAKHPACGCHWPQSWADSGTGEGDNATGRRAYPAE